MKKDRLMELAGIITEAKPKTTKDNPLVYIFDRKKGDYPDQGVIGHMHLSTAADIYGFKRTPELLGQIMRSKEGKRIGITGREHDVWLAKSKHSEAVMENIIVEQLDDTTMNKLARQVAQLIFDRSVEFMGSEDAKDARFTEVLSKQLNVFTDAADERLMQIYQTQRKTNPKINKL